MSDASQLSVEVSFDGEAAVNYMEGYLAGIADAATRDPSENVMFVEQFFREHLTQFAEIESVGGYDR